MRWKDILVAIIRDPNAIDPSPRGFLSLRPFDDDDYFHLIFQVCCLSVSQSGGHFSPVGICYLLVVRGSAVSRNRSGRGSHLFFLEPTGTCSVL